MMFLNPIFEGRTMCSKPYIEPVRSTCTGREIKGERIRRRERRRVGDRGRKGGR
jgi:hypothetical protein